MARLLFDFFVVISKKYPIIQSILSIFYIIHKNLFLILIQLKKSAELYYNIPCIVILNFIFIWRNHNG